MSKNLITLIAPTERIKQYLLQLTTFGRGHLQQSDDFIRFELLMEVIQEFVDPSLSLLDFLQNFRVPNSLHLLFADRSLKKDIVITTNFDSLLEEAVLRLGGSPRTICSINEFDSWKHYLTSNLAPIFKIHGSIERFAGGIDKEPSMETIGATLKSITQGVSHSGLPTAKHKFLDQATHDRELIVAGYSGSDDFDIVPSLHRIRPARILWIQHDAQHVAPVDVTKESQTAILKKQEADRSARERLFLDYFQNRPGVLRVIRVATQPYLFSRFSSNICATGTVGNLCNVTDFLKKWKKQRLPIRADRYAVCAELFFRMCRFAEAQRCFQKAATIIDRRSHSERAAHYCMAAARSCIERAEYSDARTWLKTVGSKTAKKLPPDLLARYWHHLGFVAMKRRDIPDAFRYFRKAQAFSKKNRNLFIAASALHDEGLLFQDLGKYAKAISCFRNSIPLSAAIGDIRHISWSKFQIATVLFYLGQFKRSKALYLESKEIAERLGDLNHVNNCLHGLALLQFLEGDSAGSIRNCRRCIEIAQFTGQNEATGMDWQHIGVCLMENGHFLWADQSFARADDCYLGVGDHSTRSELCGYRTALALENGNFHIALREATEAVRLGRQSKMPEYLSRAYFMLGLVEEKLGRDKKGRLSLDVGLKLARHIKSVLLEFTYYLAHFASADNRIKTQRLLLWGARTYFRIGNHRRAMIIKAHFRTARTTARTNNLYKN